MKVLLCAFACEPNKGSEPGTGWHSALYLAELGHEVWVVTREVSREAIEAYMSRTAAMPNLRFVYVPDEKRLRAWRPGGYTANYALWQWRAYRCARKLDAELDFDVVHHITLGSLQGGSWMWKLGKPFIFGPVGGGQFAPSAFKSYFGSAWRSEWLRTWLQCKASRFNPLLIRTLRGASLTLAANSDTDRVARRIGARRTELFLDTSLPEGFIPPEPPDHPGGPELNVLWVGRLMPRKGVKLAIEALSLTNASRPVRLTIIGGGELEPRVDGWLREFGVRERVRHLGQVPWAEVKANYRQADVFLFTSLRDTFGAQVLEAMAHALPVVALDHHGVGDFVPDAAGIKVPVGRPADTAAGLARAIEWMAEHEAERRAMGVAGWQVATDFTCRKAYARISGFYREVAARGGQDKAAAAWIAAD